MRASPYDLSGYGFEPVKVETRPGRDEYVELQRGLYRRGRPVRERLLAVYAGLLASGGCEPPDALGSGGSHPPLANNRHEKPG